MPRSFTVAGLLISIAGAACGGAQSQAQGGPGGRGAFPPVEVKTIVLAARPLPQSSDYVATVRSLRSTTVQPQVEGIVRQVLVMAGDRVVPGQALIQIDPDKQQASVTAAESQRLSREADLAFARQHHARMQKLHDAGAVSRVELEQAETAFKNAEAQLAAVESLIRESEVELQYYRVTAPNAGVVGEIEIRQGDRVTQSTAITTIDQPEGLEAYVNVPLERAMDLRPGLVVELLDGNGDVIASNPVTFIAPRADDATQTVLVKATLRQLPPSIRVMQYVRARIIWSNEPALAVPIVAVTRVAGQHFVFVAEQNDTGFVARQKAVTLGDVLGEDYIVRRGLEPGARVIVSNVQKLGDGAPVKPS
ncbi:MAG: efflux RND transporter periplasmic adaptor subunit [Vicinamibacterales bacterium]